MAFTADDVRPRWWVITVSLLFIRIPTIMVSLFFVIPDTMFLDGNTIDDEHQSAVFRNIARSNACGDTLAILVCFFMLRTQDLAMFKTLHICLLVWIGLENAVVVVQELTYGQFTDPIGNIVDFLDFLLMLYMFIKLRRLEESESTQEAAPLTTPSC